MFETPRWVHPLGKGSLGLATIIVSFSLYLIFMIVQSDKTMGAVQRIFYFHVAAAISCYLFFGIVFICSVLVLVNRSWFADVVNEASAEVGFLLCSITLLSGIIWGHAAWNTWFRWEPRLVTFLLLWLIFLSFTLFRLFGDSSKIAPHSAVLGILGSITVPLVWISIKLLPQTAQLHPQVMERGGLLIPYAKATLLCTLVALTLFGLALLLVRVRVGILERIQRAFQ